MRTSVLWGALSATVLAFPLAALCALVYRFPIPFAGFSSGADAVPLALIAVAFYGLLGGFPTLLMVGAPGGWVAHRVAAPDLRRMKRLALAFGATASLLGVVLLAVLDKLIGDW